MLVGPAAGPRTLAVMRRGTGDGTVRFPTRAALTIAKSIPIDQLNVAMTSIRFRTTRPRPRGPVHACRGRSVRQGNPDHGRAEPERLHVNATGDVVYQRERYSGRECANPSSGAGHELRKEMKSPVLPATAARLRPPGRMSNGVPTRRACRCASRAPCRARGDQSQSRWWRCLRWR